MSAIHLTINLDSAAKYKAINPSRKQSSHIFGVTQARCQLVDVIAVGAPFLDVGETKVLVILLPVAYEIGKKNQAAVPVLSRSRIGNTSDGLARQPLISL